MQSKKLFAIASPLIFLAGATPVLATSNVDNIVNIKSDTGNNIVNGQVVTSNSTSQTSITTTTNGQTTRVESNESGDIHVETKDGKTTIKTSPGMKVNVTGQAEVSDDLKNPSTPSAKKYSIDASISAKVNEEAAEMHESIVARIKSFIKHILEIFHL